MISVLIPCYNAGHTIEAAVESVLAESHPAEEVIVLLDGGEDDSEVRLQKFGNRIRVLKQANQGVACARNRLVKEAGGELLAFLDADDLWHPEYLETQVRLLGKYPEAVASFTGHVSFYNSDPVWDNSFPKGSIELLDPAPFFIRYNKATGMFGSMSYCCVRKSALAEMGTEPFSNDLHAVEDSFLCYQLALAGPIAFDPSPLVAYRLNNCSLSTNAIRNLRRWVTGFERLEERYSKQSNRELREAFSRYHAARRRTYAKALMAAGEMREGRRQLLCSLNNCHAPRSLAKSLTWLAVTMLPRALQPKWPSAEREL